MMSNKWTFSLTTLITIFALALASMPASAFDVKFDAHDISYAGDIQIERRAAGTAVQVYVNFGKVVTLADVRTAFGYAPATAANTNAVAASGKIDILNYHGAVIDVVGSSGDATDTNIVTIERREVDNRLTDDPNRIQAGKDYTINITLIGAQLPATTGDNAGVVDKNDHAYRIRLFLPKDSIIEADRNAGAKNNKGFHDKIFLVNDEPDTIAARNPYPMSIALAPATLIPDAGFTGDTFDIIITLTEQPKENKLTAADHFAVDKGTASDAVYLGTTMPVDGPDLNRADLTVADTDTVVDPPTGRDNMHHQYLVTITPKAEDGDLVFKLKTFGDQEIYTYLAGPTDDDVLATGITGRGPNEWEPRVSELDRMEGVDKLTVKIKKKVDPVKVAGLEVKLLNEGIIPKDGYLVVAKNKGGSAVRDPGDAKKTPANPPRQPFALTYNLIDGGLPNLESFLSNGGTIDLVAPAAGLVISEIMWGTDASLTDAPINSQYIEIRNTSGAEIKMGDGTHKLFFYAAGTALPDMSVAANNVQDRVGTVGAGGFWGLAGKGQSGRTGIEEGTADVVAVTPTQALISMQRSISATGVAADGTMASSWAASTPPGLNFDLSKVGTRIGSPGRAPTAYPVAPTPEPEPAPAPVVPPAMADDIKITEIMVDTGSNRLPQWIELANVSGTEKNLAGWSVQITNSGDDDDVVGTSVSIDLMGTLGVGGGEDRGGDLGKALLLVAWGGRKSGNLDGSDRIVDVSSEVDQRGRYKLISDTAFMIALIPPQTTGVLEYGDTAGNLDADPAWELPMSENGRSSLIRWFEEGSEYSMTRDGTTEDAWILASDTGLIKTEATWYGSDEDAGTPGVIGGGPLPVELSHFRPARDKATGAVVITWATQSELNNAGFFIKRSQQRNGEFKVINATMIAGAGTTSEKQFYTYTDTTAQPNVVYYYQIEDVSLDGNRQTLTRGIRLKGHVGAAGKLTSTWGELKTSHE